MLSLRNIALALLIISFTVGQSPPHVEKSYNIHSELVGVPLRTYDQFNYRGQNSGAQQWQLDQFCWILLRFVSKNCCQEYTLLRSDINYLVQFEYGATQVVKCDPLLDTFQLFFLEESDSGDIKAKSYLQSSDGTYYLQEWNLIRTNSSAGSTSKSSSGCLGDRFHLMISQESFGDPNSVAMKKTNQPILLVASKDGKHGLDSVVTENESDGLIMIVIPVTCCYWIYLGVCTVFRKMGGKCAR